MQTKLAKTLGIEFPIFAFSHCRDVVAAVTNAGGFGVLGAAGLPSGEALETELEWLDRHVNGRPYGVDIIIPNKYWGQEEKEAAKLLESVRANIPNEHREFVSSILAKHNVPELPADEDYESKLAMTEATAQPFVDVSLLHENVKLIVNALGTPPRQVIDQVHASGRLIGALCGAGKHAKAHVDAGLDVIVAQGYEGGGHCGEIGSVVLWPEVVEIAGDIPVLAAGGIGSGKQMYAAMSLGAQGVWCGSVWLPSIESSNNPVSKRKMLEASSSDTTRTKYPTGKFSRCLKSEFTRAWEHTATPNPLAPPMQHFLMQEAFERMDRYPEKSADLMWIPVGQVVGRLNQEISCREIVAELVNEFIETNELMNRLLPSV